MGARMVTKAGRGLGAGGDVSGWMTTDTTELAHVLVSPGIGLKDEESFLTSSYNTANRQHFPCLEYRIAQLRKLQSTNPCNTPPAL